MKIKKIFIFFFLFIGYYNLNSQLKQQEWIDDLVYFINNEEYETAFEITKQYNISKLEIDPKTKYKLYQLYFEANIAMGLYKEADTIADNLVNFAKLNFSDTSYYYSIRHSCKVASIYMLNQQKQFDSIFKIFNDELLYFSYNRYCLITNSCENNLLYEDRIEHTKQLISHGPFTYHEHITIPLYYIDKIRNYTKYEDLYVFTLDFIKDIFGEKTYAYYWTKLYFHEDQLRYGFIKEARQGFYEVLNEIKKRSFMVYDAERYTPTHDIQRSFLYSGQIDSTIYYDKEMEKYLFSGSQTESGNKFMKRGFLNNLIGNYDKSLSQLQLAIGILNVNFNNIDSVLSTLNESYISHNYIVSLFASSRLYLGILMLNLQNFTESERLLKDAYQIASKGAGINLQRKREILQRLAITYQEMENWHKADSVYNILLQDDFRSINKAFYNQTETNRSIQYYKLKQDFDIYINYCLKKRFIDTNSIANIQNLILKTKGLIYYTGKSIKNKIENSFNPKQKEKLIQINKLEDKIAKYNSKASKINYMTLDSLISVKQQIEKELYQNIELFSDEYLRRNSNWTDIKSKLSANEATVEILRINPFDFIPNKYNTNECNYDFSDSIIYYLAIIIKKNSRNPEYVFFQNGKELETKYFEYYKKVISPNLSKLSKKDFELYTKKYKTVLRKLYSAFWKEIDSKLQNIDKIYTSFDGIYNSINPNILIDEKNNYLIDKYEFVLMTSLRDFISSNNSHSEAFGNSVALIGNPDYNFNFPLKSTDPKGNKTLDENLAINRGDKYRGAYDSLWTTLPSSELEVKSIKKILKSNKSDIKVFIKNEASKKNLKKLNSPSILHIATHGFYKKFSDNDNFSFNNTLFDNQRNPLLNTGLIFAGANTFMKSIKNNQELIDKFDDDGILTAFEAMNLNLENTKLVVLSACESGLGETKAGEGVYGLQRAFKFAGAKNVLMSYWNINDKDTKDFMERFYKKLSKNKNISKSLRETTIEFKNQLGIDNPYNHPKFWGAFMLTSSEK